MMDEAIAIQPEKSEPGSTRNGQALRPETAEGRDPDAPST